MGFFDLFKEKKVEDPDLCYIRDLIVVAKLNGEPEYSYKEWIEADIDWKNIPLYKYSQVKENLSNIKDCYPKEEKAQIDYLLALSAKMKSPLAHKYIASIAIKMGMAKKLGII